MARPLLQLGSSQFVYDIILHVPPTQESSNAFKTRQLPRPQVPNFATVVFVSVMAYTETHTLSRSSVASSSLFLPVAKVYILGHLLFGVHSIFMDQTKYFLRKWAN